MKMITLTQPWATLVALDEKRNETRSWKTDYRGDLAIHAAKNFPRGARDLVATEPFASVLAHYGIGMPELEAVLGHILCVTELYGCERITTGYPPPRFGIRAEAQHEAAFGNYGSGRWAWQMDRHRKLRQPVEAVGHQGIRDLDREIAADVEAELVEPGF